MNSFSMSLSPLAGVTKTGVVKPDEHGYRPMCLGAFEIHNSVGDYYAVDRMVRALFDASSELMRRAEKGALRGEMEHPMPGPNDKPSDYLERVVEISKDRESHIIRSIYLDEKNFRDNNGKPVIGVVGLVKPSGVFGHLLEQSMLDPYQNVAFSIRSISENSPMANRRLRRYVRKIITWDWVTEGGIEVADKYWSPALESAARNKDFNITRELALESRSRIPDTVANESVRLNIDDLIRTFGWDMSQEQLFNW